MFGQQKEKTGMKTGAIYGIAGAIFYLGIVYSWAFLNSDGTLLAQYGGLMRYVTLAGLILFSPLMIVPTAILSLAGPGVSDDFRNLFMVISLPLMGALIGTAFSYAAGWWERSGASGVMTPFRKT